MTFFGYLDGSVLLAPQTGEDITHCVFGEPDDCI